jgi:hypothetical protein
MATGILGKASLSENTNTVVYIVPTGKTAVCTINVCNTTSARIRFQLALASTKNPQSSEWIEYDITTIGQAFVRSGIVIGEGTRIIAWANTIGLNVMAWGYEE